MRESKPIRPTTRLSRHASLLRKPPPSELNRWLRVKRQRSLSVPDLNKLSKEWATYQQSDGIMNEDTKLQVIKILYMKYGETIVVSVFFFLKP
jgi:hypothetical protein